MEEIMLQKMVGDVKLNSNSFICKTLNDIDKQAEIYAERYVSSVLGLDDSDSSKKDIKKEYIYLFTERCKQL